MTRLNKLEKDLSKAQDHIERLQSKRAAALETVTNDPDNEKAAIAAAAAEMQVSAAVNAKTRIMKDIEAERQLMHEQELEKARDQLADLEKQANEIQAEGIALIRSFYDKYHKFVEVTKEYAALGNKYKLDHKPLFMRDRAEAGLDSIHSALMPWYAHREHVEYRKEHPIGG